MTTITEHIENRGYELLGNLDDEESILEDFFNYSGGTYICDAISEIADGSIPIYNGDIWAGASSISDYIEEAISEGIAPTHGNDIDLMRIFQAGYYVYYQQSLYDNLENLCFNFVADKINEFLSDWEGGDIDNLNISEIEKSIGIAVSEVDNNDYFSILEDKASYIISCIEGGEYETE